jgi:hypothetical protein
MIGGKGNEPDNWQQIVSMKKVAPPCGVAPRLSALDLEAVSSKNRSRRMVDAGGGDGEQK